MEKYVFIKKGNGLLPISISDRLYKEIIHLPEDPEKQVPDLPLDTDPEEMMLIDKSDIGIELSTEVTSIFVKDRDYFRRIEFKYIRWIEAAGSYSCLKLDNAPNLMLSFNLRELSGRLPARLFVRVHRSYIVNIDFIDSFIGNVLCIGKDQIPVSKQHKRYIVGRLNILGNVKW